MTINAGDAVEVRTASGDWRPATAKSEPRIDWPSLFHGQPPYESVLVSFDLAHPVNWPSGDVRPHETTEP